MKYLSIAFLILSCFLMGCPDGDKQKKPPVYPEVPGGDKTFKITIVRGETIFEPTDSLFTPPTQDTLLLTTWAKTPTGTPTGHQLTIHIDPTGETTTLDINGLVASVTLPNTSENIFTSNPSITFTSEKGGANNVTSIPESDGNTNVTVIPETPDHDATGYYLSFSDADGSVFTLDDPLIFWVNFTQSE